MTNNAQNKSLVCKNSGCKAAASFDFHPRRQRALGILFKTAIVFAGEVPRHCFHAQRPDLQSQRTSTSWKSSLEVQIAKDERTQEPHSGFL